MIDRETYDKVMIDLASGGQVARMSAPTLSALKRRWDRIESMFGETLKLWCRIDTLHVEINEMLGVEVKIQVRTSPKGEDEWRSKWRNMFCFSTCIQRNQIRDGDKITEVIRTGILFIEAFLPDFESVVAGLRTQEIFLKSVYIRISSDHKRINVLESEVTSLRKDSRPDGPSAL